MSQTARKFFLSEELKERLVSGLPQEKREVFRRILAKTTVLLQAMECDKESFI